MTGIGTDSPRDLEEFIKDSRRRLVALERRQSAAYTLPSRLGPDASLLNSTDLDTVFDSGWYVQHNNTNATLARNYPIASRAGELEVVGNVSGTDFAMQRYTEYSNNGTGALPRVWHRTYYNTGWSGWASSAPTAKGTMSASTPPSGFEGGFTYGEADSSSFPTNFGTVEVVRKADVRAVQRLSEKTGYQRTWHRAAGDGDTWGPWVLDGGDSDWKPLTAQNGWLFATPNPSYRIRGDTCYFKGEFYAGANQTVVFNLPAEARPGSRTAVMIARFATTSTPAFGTLAINTTGDCTFNLLGGTIPTASPGITLLGVSYLLD